MDGARGGAGAGTGDGTGGPIRSELDVLLAGLRRRRPEISVATFNEATAKLIPALRPDGNPDVCQALNDWLQGLWELHLYQEKKALAHFDKAAAQVDACLKIDSESPELNELLCGINEGRVEALFMLNDYAVALDLANLLMQARMATADRRKKAYASMWVGACQQQLGQYQAALKILARSVSDFDFSGTPAEASRSMNCLAILHEELGDFERALPLYKEALRRAEADNNADMEGRVLANWGDALVTQGKYAEGLDLLKRAVKVLKSIGAHWHYAWCELSIGKLHELKGEYAKSIKMHESALTAVRKSDSPRIEAEILASYGKVLGESGDYSAACEKLGQALEIATQLGVEREIFKTHRLLSSVHKQFGYFEKALEHFELFHETRARVYDQMAHAKLQQMESEFELERTKRDKELFQLKNVQLANALEDVNRLNVELSEKANVLEDLSNHDVLTGLHNRRFFTSRLAEELQRFERYGTGFSLAIFDVDKFKDVNDRFSHSIGDEVLIILANIVENALRESDVLARFGGEEFAIILPSAPLPEAHRAMEKLRDIVARYDWHDVAPGMVITISVGVVQIALGETHESVLHRADGLLYQAKNAGRNRVCS